MEGGELFERIIDDDYHLTEVDCMVFVRQICEGIRFMHHMGVLHLDLKVLGVTVAGPRGTAGHWLAVGGVPVGQNCSGVRTVSCRTHGLLDLCSGDVLSGWWGNCHPVPTA